MSSAAPDASSSRSRRAAIGRWFATAMDRLRLRRRRSPSSTASASAPPLRPPRFSGAGSFEASPPPPPSPPSGQVPPAPSRRPPPPPPDPVRRPRPRTVPLSELAAGRALVSWLPPSERRCRLCRMPYDGAKTELEHSTPWEEREQAVRVAGCDQRPTAHVVGRRCLQQWLDMGGMEACPLCAFACAQDD
ncbi:hypothetical protein GTA08_BOTSDO08498 [Botryosphaeria dothidea]|uniref:RING-CH-type domain-containing protein n=1 Tax=Botryosphaeria dothidea TaxID=55169 RepID=A0A8H4IME9_9PEZI|nr:hypothetical protein GTA08_BOTSDO08498 [Botryosphaeria dothidea]